MDLFLSFISSHPFFSLFLLFFTLLFLLFLHDILQKKHAIVHNFPIVGHLRYFLESIGPELRQYLVANDKEETPFNRDERSWIYATAKKQNNTFGFGTTELLYNTGYPIIKHKTLPLPAEKAKHFSQEDDTTIPCSKILGGYHKRPKAFRPPSIINISAMSFGSLGYRAQSSLNQGAKVANCYHNTGEGAISPYHCFGADLVWQLGTGYFGTRDSEGNFCLETFKDKIQQHPQVKMIEIKLSQGAKPGKGGILPGAKVTPEIAEIRGIPVGETCYSPNTHSAFSTTDELITFTETLADASGLPVGIKSAIGDIAFWKELVQRMIDRNEGPDFISIDGSEGGTGAAPLTFSDHVSLPFKVGFSRVYKVFLDAQITDRVAFIGSGKLGFPDRTIIALAMGADMINVAREAMMSIGCIQAQKCHEGTCPAGVATQNKFLQAGLNIEHKAARLANYIMGFRKELLLLSHACGYHHPAQFTEQDVEFSVGVNKFDTLESVLGYKKHPISIDF